MHNIITYKKIASVTCSGPVYSLCFIDNITILAGVNFSEMVSVDVQTGKVIKKYDGRYILPSLVVRGKPAITVVCIHLCWE